MSVMFYCYIVWAFYNRVFTWLNRHNLTDTKTTTALYKLTRYEEDILAKGYIQ